MTLINLVHLLKRQVILTEQDGLAEGYVRVVQLPVHVGSQTARHIPIIRLRQDGAPAGEAHMAEAHGLTGLSAPLTAWAVILASAPPDRP